MLALMLGVSLWQPPVSARLEGGSALKADEGRWRAVSVAAFAIIALASGAMALNAATRASLEITGPQSTSTQAARSVSASRVWPLDAHIAYLTSLHAAWASSTVPQYVAEKTDLVAIEKRERHSTCAIPRTRSSTLAPCSTTSSRLRQVDAAFAEAFRRYPTFPLAHAEYAVYLATNGRIDEARYHLDIARLPDDQDARAGRGHQAGRVADCWQRQSEACLSASATP